VAFDLAYPVMMAVPMLYIILCCSIDLIVFDVAYLAVPAAATVLEALQTPLCVPSVAALTAAPRLTVPLHSTQQLTSALDVSTGAATGTQFMSWKASTQADHMQCSCWASNWCFGETVRVSGDVQTMHALTGRQIHSSSSRSRSRSRSSSTHPRCDH
jgi:hypothetical protein